MSRLVLRVFGLTKVAFGTASIIAFGLALLAAWTASVVPATWDLAEYFGVIGLLAGIVYVFLPEDDELSHRWHWFLRESKLGPFLYGPKQEWLPIIIGRQRNLLYRWTVSRNVMRTGFIVEVGDFF